MLKLSKLADYAVIIISCLDTYKGDSISASVLAQDTRLPEPTVAKVLKLLSGAGIVTSTRGVKGGYSLSRSLSHISIKDVIVALDGPIAMTACVEDSGEGCDFAPQCSMHGRWNQVNHAIKTALENVSIASMTAPVKIKKRA